MWTKQRGLRRPSDTHTAGKQAHTTFASRARLGAAMTVGLMASLLMAGPAAAQQGATRTMNVDNSGVFSNAFEYIKHNAYVKLGYAQLDYTGDSTELKVEDATGLAAQTFGPGTSTLDNTGSAVDDKSFAAGTIGLYIPRTGRHLAAEITLAAPIELDVLLTGRAVNESLAPYALIGNGPDNSIPTGVPPLGRKLGTVKVLPPNFTLLYRPWVESTIQPYLGAGAMWLYSYDTDVSNEILTTINEPDLDLSKPVACVGQVGVDINLTESIFINADAKWIGCAEIKADLNNVKVDAPNLSDQFGAIEVGTVSTRLDFEATLYQLSVGVRF